MSEKVIHEGSMAGATIDLDGFSYVMDPMKSYRARICNGSGVGEDTRFVYRIYEEDWPRPESMAAKNAQVHRQVQTIRYFRLGCESGVVVCLDSIEQISKPRFFDGPERWCFTWVNAHGERLAVYPTEQAARDAYERLTAALCGEDEIGAGPARSGEG